MERDVIQLLKRLVEIDSVNPALVPGAAGEGEVAAYVASWAERAGLRAEVIEGTAGRPSVLVRARTPVSGRTLLLCGHLDTVGVEGMADPHVPRADGDRLHGRGAYDMKAGLAAALIACRDAIRAGSDVVVAAVADEEHASLGVQEALDHLGRRAGGPGAAAAIVTEPTELAVATAHKGFAWVEIEVTGKAAHGSRPHLGVDAILKTAPILVALDRLDRALREREHPRLGPGTLHASLIGGGREESTIPDRCVLAYERRTLPGETRADVEKEVVALLAECRAADPELRAAGRTLLTREPFETPDSAPVVRAVAAAAAEVLGAPQELAGVSYWADSAFISAAGIPTVLFGPRGDGAHAAVEWVSMDSTVACAKILTTATRELCR